MGTSTRWPGPSGSGWTAPSRNLTRTLQGVTAPSHDAAVPAPREPDSSPPPALSTDEIGRAGTAFQDALASELTQDPNRFGLIEGIESAGSRLLETLEDLDRRIPIWHAACEGTTVEDRSYEFVTSFADEVAGPLGLQTDAAIRHAATEAAYTILEKDSRVRHTIETGESYDSRLNGELFCAVYQIFFAKAVAGFLQSVIAAKITLMAPILPVIDPAGHIADWIAEKIMSILPTPCEQEGAQDDETSLAELGRNLLQETVLRALGLPVDDKS